MIQQCGCSLCYQAKARPFHTRPVSNPAHGIIIPTSSGYPSRFQTAAIALFPLRHSFLPEHHVRGGNYKHQWRRSDTEGVVFFSLCGQLSQTWLWTGKERAGRTKQGKPLQYQGQTAHIASPSSFHYTKICPSRLFLPAGHVFRYKQRMEYGGSTIPSNIFEHSRHQSTGISISEYPMDLTLATS